MYLYSMKLTLKSTSRLNIYLIEIMSLKFMVNYLHWATKVSIITTNDTNQILTKYFKSIKKTLQFI